MAAFTKTSTSPSGSPTSATTGATSSGAADPAPISPAAAAPFIEPTDAARREALAWRRLSTAADPMAAPSTVKLPPEILQQAQELEADIVSHGGQLSDAIGVKAMLSAIANQRARFPDSISSSNVYFVDMGLDNQAPRGYILDLETNKVARGPFRVAAGMASGPMNGVPKCLHPRPEQEHHRARSRHRLQGRDGHAPRRRSTIPRRGHVLARCWCAERRRRRRPQIRARRG
jgi:hypothetical protein